MLRFLTALLVAGVAIVGLANAGGSKLKIGAPAPAFSNLPGVDDKMASLGDYKKDVLVVCITCNHCPVAVAYEDRMIDFAKKYKGKIDFVAINVNNGDADKLDKMKIRAEQKGFNFPYLYDASQKIAKDLNAKVTPEFYVFDKNRKLVYWGAMDDTNNAKNVKTNYLDLAVTSVLNGDEVKTSTTKARGCGVQFGK